MSTTEETYTTTLFVDTDNTTDVLDVTTTTLTTLLPKKTAISNDCACNILYKTCDINCCCDVDCGDIEKDLFSDNCENHKVCGDTEDTTLNFCSSDATCLTKTTKSYFVDNLFCIAKTNLPPKQLTIIKFDLAALSMSPKWQSFIPKQDFKFDFKRTLYKYNDAIWLTYNGTIFNSEIPIPTVSGYCSTRKPIQFLVNENIKCIVKLEDLHMFEIYTHTKDASVLSPKTEAANSNAVV
ncbi:unnamed protein product [Leptidea sinapis]|uniref:Tectonic-1-3 N-terminal domain-containing protein n=1 Tax=Leptidea sinapis TaxID=189913 RepID=A0A5E4QI12_9NEOP|nr:unnamed protein product [Leptidea sinapis]